jgi:hypothetical protein
MEYLHIPDEFRVYPLPFYVLERLEARLRVDQRAYKSVVFIGVENERGFTPYGTAEVGAARYEDQAFILLITALHVVKAIPGDYVTVRANRFDGSATCVKVHKAGILRIEEPPLDIAIIPISLDPTIYDYFVVKLSMAYFKELIEKYGTPGLGDEVCIVGLYTTHYGHVRNIPTVRIGHVAGVSEEPVMTDRGYVHGWLIECYSIAGLSGSPVFWQAAISEEEKAKPLPEGKHHTDFAYIPIGILIGYHVIESKEDEIVVPQFQVSREERDHAKMAEPSKVEQRRTGFAVVIPFYLLYHIFESEQMQSMFKKAADLQRTFSGYKTASAKPPGFDAAFGVGPPSDANPNAREDFNSLLGAAVKKPAQED